MKYRMTLTFTTGTLKGMTITETRINYMKPGTEITPMAWCGPGYIVDACEAV